MLNFNKFMRHSISMGHLSVERLSTYSQFLIPTSNNILLSTDNRSIPKDVLSML